MEFFDPGSFGGAIQTGATRIRTGFTEKDRITTLVQLMDYGSKEAADAAISTGSTDGMEVSYQRLDALVAGEQGE